MTRQQWARGKLATAAAAMIWALSANAAPPKGAGALLGSWQFDASKSVFQGAIPYTSATYTFENTPNGVHVTAHIVEGAGRLLHFEYVDTQDGNFVPVTGNPFYDSESTKWTDSGEATRTERRKDQVTGQTNMAVSKDGKTFTATARRTLPDGRLYTSKIVWNHVSDASSSGKR